jgi:hypothetical protein
MLYTTRKYMLQWSVTVIQYRKERKKEKKKERKKERKNKIFFSSLKHYIYPSLPLPLPLPLPLSLSPYLPLSKTHSSFPFTDLIWQ